MDAGSQGALGHVTILQRAEGISIMTSRRGPQRPEDRINVHVVLGLRGNVPQQQEDQRPQLGGSASELAGQRDWSHRANTSFVRKLLPAKIRAAVALQGDTDVQLHISCAFMPMKLHG